ncbi:MAG: sigma-70 family RNA polymerase sigma factor [Myxococcales bacterium]|nr:sigma-70 family RNA polymerase sigma factor [Myxococcales bacterium]
MGWSASDQADASLIERALRGESRARRALVERVGPTIQARVRHLTGGRPIGAEGPDDLVQQVFERLLRDDGRLLRAWQPDRGSLQAYCSVIARSVVSERRRVARPMADALPDGADEAPGPEQVTSARERLQQLRACLRRCLSPGAWLVFMGLYADRREPAELADGLGRPRRWVDDRHREIRQAAARCAEAEPPEVP